MVRATTSHDLITESACGETVSLDRKMATDQITPNPSQFGDSESIVTLVRLIDLDSVQLTRIPKTFPTETSFPRDFDNFISEMIISIGT